MTELGERSARFAQLGRLNSPIMNGALVLLLVWSAFATWIIFLGGAELLERHYGRSCPHSLVCESMEPEGH